MSLFEQLRQAAEQKFKCSRCGHNRALVDRIATSGAGLSRFFDIQNRRLIMVSCTRCGYTDLFNERAVRGDSFSASDILDFFLGG